MAAPFPLGSLVSLSSLSLSLSWSWGFVIAHGGALDRSLLVLGYLVFVFFPVGCFGSFLSYFSVGFLCSLGCCWISGLFLGWYPLRQVDNP
uniref:Transmembrane protein n=1 Tax=Arundo donax TaxID=35708 RepID=A0A0A9ENX3_ARUDO